MPTPDNEAKGEFSSYYGCYIIAMAGLVFVGIIAWSGWTLYSQDKAISLITQDTPIELSTSSPLNNDEQSSLQNRLTAFAQSTQSGQAASLELSVADLNQIIRTAPDSGFGTYREMVRITQIDSASGHLFADLCLPLKKLKFWEGKMRYLVGKGTFQVSVETEGVDAKLISIEIPGKSVPEGFVNNLQVWPWIAPYRKQEPIGQILRSIKSAKFRDNAIMLSTTSSTVK